MTLEFADQFGQLVVDVVLQTSTYLIPIYMIRWALEKTMEVMGY